MQKMLFQEGLMAFGLLTGLTIMQPTQAQDHPNVILIMTNDQG